MSYWISQSLVPFGDRANQVTFYKGQTGLKSAYLFHSPFTMLEFSSGIDGKPVGSSARDVDGTWIREPEVNHQFLTKLLHNSPGAIGRRG